MQIFSKQYICVHKQKKIFYNFLPKKLSYQKNIINTFEKKTWYETIIITVR